MLFGQTQWEVMTQKWICMLTSSKLFASSSQGQVQCSSVKQSTAYHKIGSLVQLRNSNNGAKLSSPT
jgi:hypothetical protein